MPNDITRIIIETVARTPDWLRRDLASEDGKLRGQAEETLAVMLSAALDKAPIDSSD